MGMMNITFKQVDAFRAVVSSGSVTGASVILGTSQPAVSRLISDLEKEIGYELFFRYHDLTIILVLYYFRTD